MSESEITKYQDVVAKTENLIGMAERAVIYSDEDQAKAGDLYKLIGLAVRRTEDRRKELTGPLNETVKKLNAAAKLVTEPLRQAQAALKVKMDTHAREQQRRAEEAAREAARVAEAQALEDARVLEDAGMKDAADSVMESAGSGAAAVASTARATTVRGEAIGSTTSVRMTWNWKVLEEEKIPRKWLMVDTRAVDQFLREVRRQAEEDADRQGLKGKMRETAILNKTAHELREAIPGVRFYREAQAAVR